MSSLRCSETIPFDDTSVVSTGNSGGAPSPPPLLLPSSSLTVDDNDNVSQPPGRGVLSLSTTLSRSPSPNSAASATATTGSNSESFSDTGSETAASSPSVVSSPDGTVNGVDDCGTYAPTGPDEYLTGDILTSYKYVVECESHSILRERFDTLLNKEKTSCKPIPPGWCSSPLRRQHHHQGTGGGGDGGHQGGVGAVREGWRKKIVEWFFQVADAYHLHRETVSISMSFLDRFLSLSPLTPPIASPTSSGGNGTPTSPPQHPLTQKKLFQLASLTSLYVTTKLHSASPMSPPLSIPLLLSLSRDSFTRSDIVRMEKLLLRRIGWELYPPQPMNYVRPFVRILEESHREHIFSQKLPQKQSRKQLQQRPTSRPTSPLPTSSPDVERIVLLPLRTLLETAEFHTELSVCEGYFNQFPKHVIAIASVLNAMDDNNTVDNGRESKEVNEGLSPRGAYTKRVREIWIRKVWEILGYRWEDVSSQEKEMSSPKFSFRPVPPSPGSPVNGAEGEGDATGQDDAIRQLNDTITTCREGLMKMYLSSQGYNALSDPPPSSSASSANAARCSTPVQNASSTDNQRTPEGQRPRQSDPTYSDPYRSTTSSHDGDQQRHSLTCLDDMADREVSSYSTSERGDDMDASGKNGTGEHRQYLQHCLRSKSPGIGIITNGDGKGKDDRGQRQAQHHHQERKGADLRVQTCMQFNMSSGPEGKGKNDASSEGSRDEFNPSPTSVINGGGEGEDDNDKNDGREEKGKKRERDGMGEEERDRKFCRKEEVVRVE